jgi:N-acetylglucosamine-6-phosphate deacetylase
MTQALVNGRIFGPQGLLAQHAVLFAAGRIIDIVHEDDPRVRAAEQEHQLQDLQAALLLPGFIDLQVNGGGGVLFNDEPTVAGIRAIGEAHRRHGTTGFLPTLISDDLSVVAQAIAAVQEAIAVGVPGVMGIHIEGPFLSQLRKGVHNSALIRRPDADIVALLSGLSNGTTLVTLAPEVTTPEVLRQLHARGVVLSAGHTNATYADITTALKHGLTGFTHLFNAMSQLTGREPGVVGAALHDPGSYCGIIVDGHHVDPVVLNIALSAKRHDRFMLVTDAMPCAGTDLTSFMLQGRRITVQGDYCVDDGGTLAGTALTMDRAVRNTSALLGLPQATAIRMASEYPADFLGRGAELGRIAPGCRANFVAVDAALNVQHTWIDGRMVP